MDKKQITLNVPDLQAYIVAGRVWYRARLDNAAARLVHWLIKRRTVQEVIASQFSSDTPMCKVLANAVEDAVDGSSVKVSVDDIVGLDDYIEREIDYQASDKLDSIGDERWFSDAVRDAINHDEVAETVADNGTFIETLADHIVEDHSDKIIDVVIERLQERARERRIQQRLRKARQQAKPLVFAATTN